MKRMMIVRKDAEAQRDARASDVTRAWRGGQDLIWIDFDQPPDGTDQGFLRDELGISESALDHLTRQHRGPRAVRFRTYMLVVIYDIDRSIEESAIEKDELVLLFGDRYLISVRGGRSARLDEVSANIDRSVERFGHEIGAIVYAIFDSIADKYLEIVEDVRLQVEALEDRVLRQEEPDGVTQLYVLRRQLSGLRRVIAPEESLIGMTSSPGMYMVNPEIQEAMFDVKHDLGRAVDDIDQYLNMLPDILTTFEALKSDNLNRIVKLLTVWSIILTAVALLPTVLGISLAREPTISPYLGYAVSIVLMALVGAGIWYFFRRHGWVE